MVKQINREELEKLLEKNRSFKLIDVLTREHFEKEHIKGAISLPADEIDGKATAMFKKNDLIVTYCAGFDCTASTHAAEKLQALGFTNVLDYKGGLKDYKESDRALLEGTLHQQDDPCALCPGCC